MSFKTTFNLFSLYDNSAECADELAFRKGDIVVVVDQHVAGTSGWWMCSLYGRHGLAPANRLQLIPQTEIGASSPHHAMDKPIRIDATANDSMQNIYQIPIVPRPSSSPAYERMDMIYKVPSTPFLPQKDTSPEWIYDVPVGPEKPSPPQGSYDSMPYKGVCRQLYDTVPARAWPTQRGSTTPSVYDIPKPSSLDIPTSPKVAPVLPIYDKPPTQTLTEESVYAVPPKDEHFTQVSSDSPSDHIPLECRGDSSSVHELNRVQLQRMRNFLACTSFHDLPGSGGSLVGEDIERGRILTASSSSTSSCDSLALSSSSPEPLREVTLCQDEACRRLLDLQGSICRAVPQLMEFVSSHWRSKEHLQKHLKEIKEAAERIASSLTCFLSFALDVKGNARRLTDANLQTRLYKQLSILEDSGVILQQTVSALNMAGWLLSTLCQDPGKVQTPDQLERFVMVARTIPEDVKRLVSIIIANGRLLFRASQKDSEPVNTTGQPETNKTPDRDEQGGDLVEDDNDYVELQTKNEFEKQQNKMERDPKENVTTASNKAQVVFDMLSSSPPVLNFSTTQAHNKRHSSESSTEEHQSSFLSEHCRLYFGALQKAIGGFVGSLQDGQPPEKFISQSKLVIMVGQRLVDTLCREAQRGGSSQSLLCKSNHLCALLKQLAVATKKAALHFPDKQALHEAQEFAMELAQRAGNFITQIQLPGLQF
uniref:Cas scaffold protein family member 4 n=1 Tax=Scophthalmus maximus TaxID=52904 RepID=A0A8D3DYQ3_SCOMX